MALSEGQKKWHYIYQQRFGRDKKNLATLFDSGDYAQFGAGTVTPTGSYSFDLTVAATGLSKDVFVEGLTYRIEVYGLSNIEVWAGTGVGAQKITSDGITTLTIAAGNTALYFNGVSIGSASLSFINVREIVG